MQKRIITNAFTFESNVSNPEKCQDPDIYSFVQLKDELSISDGVVLRNHRLVVPDGFVEENNQHRTLYAPRNRQDKSAYRGEGTVFRYLQDGERDRLRLHPMSSDTPPPTTPFQHETFYLTPLPSVAWIEIVLDFSGLFMSGGYMLVDITECSRNTSIKVGKGSHLVFKFVICQTRPIDYLFN